MQNIDFILTLYQSKQTVFRLADVARLVPSVDPKYLSDRLSYYVNTNRLYKVRMGIYVKPDYNPLALANTLFTPAYISLEYVLQQAGVLFQYDSRFTCISYLSRELKVDGHIFSYRKMKEEIMLHANGVIQNEAGYTIATAERALLDLLYLNKGGYLDNIHLLDKQLIMELLPIYQNQALERRVIKLLKDDQ